MYFTVLHLTSAVSVAMFVPVFASLLLTSATMAQDEVCCPPGWWRAGEACYVTSQARMTWYKAQEVLSSQNRLG